MLMNFGVSSCTWITVVRAALHLLWKMLLLTALNFFIVGMKNSFKCSYSNYTYQYTKNWCHYTPVTDFTDC